MKIILLSVALGIASATSAVADPVRIELNNIYPLTQEIHTLRDRAYFTQDNQGFFEVIEGPLEEGPARCIGSGFVFRDGTSTVAGICIFGEGDDTFTIDWTAGAQGLANTWVVRQGTGRFEGMTGEGIATTSAQIMYRAMPLRQSHIVGTVELAE